jgi:hypothetical protein
MLVVGINTWLDTRLREFVSHTCFAWLDMPACVRFMYVFRSVEAVTSKCITVTIVYVQLGSMCQKFRKEASDYLLYMYKFAVVPAFLSCARGYTQI